MRVVVDARVIVALLIPMAHSADSSQKVAAWQAEATDLYAPLLFEYEMVSAVRRAVAAGMIGPAQAAEAAESLLMLGVQTVRPTRALHRRALAWSEQLPSGSGYDAQYVALAEQLRADLWTADRGLAEAAQQLGLAWVRWIGEPSSSPTDGREDAVTDAV